MKKVLAKLGDSILSKEEMQKIKGGLEDIHSYSCTMGNGQSFMMVGTQEDMKTMILISCGPCTYSCVVC